VWTLAHVLVATRRRIPVYDVPLPGDRRDATAPASDRVSEAHGAGAR
jgi:hypothetical protein